MAESNASAAAPVIPETSAESSEALESSDEGVSEAVASPAVGTPKASDAAKPKETKTEKAANKKKLQLKLDGKVEEMELDLDNEEELVKHLQMSKMGQKRMQEKAELEKNVRQFFEAFQKDPLSVLMDPSLNISDEQRKQLAQTIINGELEEMKKSPEQKEKERLQKEYEALKKQVEDEKKAREAAEMAALQEKYAVDYDNQITEAISSSGLPKTARTVKHMAEAMMFALENNIDLSPKDLVPYIKKQTLAEFKDMISSLPDEEFENWVGKDRISNMRKKNLQKMKQAADAAAKVKDPGEAKKVDEKPKQKMDFKDFMKGVGGKW